MYVEMTESSMILDGQRMSMDHAKGIVINQLQQFEGFDGNGYFVLGKPLLTGIVANMLTYVIILIQFKTGS